MKYLEITRIPARGRHCAELRMLIETVSRNGARYVAELTLNDETLHGFIQMAHHAGRYRRKLGPLTVQVTRVPDASGAGSIEPAPRRLRIVGDA